MTLRRLVRFTKGLFDRIDKGELTPAAASELFSVEANRVTCRERRLKLREDRLQRKEKRLQRQDQLPHTPEVSQ